ncbi:MAG TPA: hypothetical protein VHJ19_03890 [Gammaproteobacteria bacterium]|nr:hypothetical protein [Gammaproteobacteria bacterium]
MAITRCPQAFAQDDDRTGVTSTDTDRFCLDYKRLTLALGTGACGTDGSEYRAEINSFSKIVAGSFQGGRPSWFEVRTKAG